MSTMSEQEALKYKEQIERKRAYNQRYYHEKVKPKRNQEKQTLAMLQERCQELEAYIAQMTGRTDFDSRIQEENNQLRAFIQQLQTENERLQDEIEVLNTNLDIARKRNYELKMERATDLLPKLETLSLSLTNQ